MGNQNYTSGTAQIIQAVSGFFSTTNAGMLYFLITVISLLSVLYVCFEKVQQTLFEIEKDIKTINLNLEVLNKNIVSFSDAKYVKNKNS